MEYVGLYAFVPAYTFAEPTQIGNGIRIDNDFMAWLGVMRRVNYMLKIGLNLSDLEARSEQVVKVMDTKIAELDRSAPQLGVRDYLAQLAEGFNEVTFAPLADVWEEAMRRLLDEDEEGEENEGN